MKVLLIIAFLCVFGSCKSHRKEVFTISATLMREEQSFGGWSDFKLLHTNNEKEVVIDEDKSIIVIRSFNPSVLNIKDVSQSPYSPDNKLKNVTYACADDLTHPCTVSVLKEKEGSPARIEAIIISYPTTQIMYR